MPPSAEPIDLPNDPRVQHRYALLNGVKYHYLYAEPKNGEVRVTVVLVCIMALLFLCNSFFHIFPHMEAQNSAWEAGVSILNGCAISFVRSCDVCLIGTLGSRMARLFCRLEVSNSSVSRAGLQSDCSGYDGIWRDSKYSPSRRQNFSLDRPDAI
jgi:hypothetical protein